MEEKKYDKGRYPDYRAVGTCVGGFWGDINDVLSGRTKMQYECKTRAEEYPSNNSI